MVTYILRIPYESGKNSYTASFTLYKYNSVVSFISPDAARIPNPEFLFSLEPFLKGEKFVETIFGNIFQLIINEIEKEHQRCVTKILGYEFIISVTNM